MLNDVVYPTIGTIVGGVVGDQISKQDVLPEFMNPYAAPIGSLIGGNTGSLSKYVAIPNSYVLDMLQNSINDATNYFISRFDAKKKSAE